MSPGLRLAPWLVAASLPLLGACGGGQDAGIGDPVYEVIEGLYPNDDAIGYKAGDLRGIWRIDFGK